MIGKLKQLFSRKSVGQSPPQRVFVIYAHAPDKAPDQSEPLHSFEPPFFPSDKIDSFSVEEFSRVAKVFRCADHAVDHLYRCTQPDMVPCMVYVLDGDRWIRDERATDFFHKNLINY